MAILKILKLITLQMLRFSLQGQEWHRHKFVLENAEIISRWNAWKVSKFGIFLARIFWHSDWIRRNTGEILLISRYYVQMRTRKTPNMDTFHAMLIVDQKLKKRIYRLWKGNDKILILQSARFRSIKTNENVTEIWSRMMVLNQGLDSRLD